MNRNGPELEEVVHPVQQIVSDRTGPGRVAEEGLVLTILNLARENLLLLFLFVISFSISKSCIPCCLFSSDLKLLNS